MDRRFDQYIDVASARQFEDDLGELLRIPSVSADSRIAGDVRRAAEWMAAQLRSAWARRPS